MAGTPPIPQLAGLDQSEWLDEVGRIADDLSDSELEKVRSWLTELTSEPGNAPAQAVASDIDLIIEKRTSAAKEKALASYAEGKPAPADIDGDGKVSKLEQEAGSQAKADATEATAEAARQQAQAEGASPEEAEMAAQSATDQLDSFFDGEKPVPGAIAQYTSYAIDGRPTPQQIQALMDAWNTLNPMAPVRTSDELFDRMGEGGPQGGPMQQQVAEIAFLGAEPIIDYRIPTIDGGSYTVSAATFQALNRELGYTSAEMTSAVRAAARSGLFDGRGEPAWQLLLGLANATRQRDALTPDTSNPQREVDQLTERVQSLSRQKGVLINRARGIAEKADGPSSEFESIMEQVATVDEELQEATGQLSSVRADANSAGVAVASQNFTSSQSLASLGSQFNAGRKLYGGDDMLGLLHTVDPTLAARVATTDPDKMSLDDRRRALEITTDMGLTPNQLTALGYGWVSNYNEQGLGGSGSGGGGERIRMQPDPAALRQAAKDLYVSLYAAEPSEAQLDQLASSVTSAIASAPDDQTIDPSARLRQAAEQLPEYREFYGNKPGGMTEQEYRGQFDQAAGAILGTTAADPSVIQSGLRTGKTQTSVGAAAASRGAWESSTWMGRLAAAAQTVAQYT